MRSIRRSVSIALTFLFAAQTVTPPALVAGNPFGKIKRLVQETKYKGTEPCTGQDCAIECLAENIDWLEHYVDEYGSVVAKQPDIWGEARLTKHRDEYERIMFRQLNQFKSTINASIAQGDSSFLNQAIALSNAASGGIPQLPATIDPDAVRGDGLTKIGISDDSAISLEPTVMLDQQARYLKHLHTIRRVNEGDDTSDSPGYSLNLVRVPVSILPGKVTRQGFGAEVTITAEPVLSDDLMPTTFRNLAINDIVDFMGLPLVRCTERLDDVRKALGDDVPVTAKPTDRVEITVNSALTGAEVFDRAVKDLFNAFAKSSMQRDVFVFEAKEPINRVLQNQVAYETYFQSMVKFAEYACQKTDIGTSYTDGATKEYEKNLRGFTGNYDDELLKVSVEYSQDVLAQYFSRLTRDQLDDYAADIERLITAISQKKTEEIANAIYDLAVFDLQRNYENRGPYLVAAEKTLARFNEVASEKAAGVALSPTGRARRAINPINPSSLEPVIGLENIALISSYFEKAYYGRYIRWNGGSKGSVCDEQRVNLLDARRFLRAEIEAAYELLSTPRHVELFAKLAAPGSQLAMQIRGAHFDYDSDDDLPKVNQYRYYFFQQLHAKDHGGSMVFDGSGGSPLSTPCVVDRDVALLADIEMQSGVRESAKSSVEALAWAIVVEAALLNERLNRDIRKLANAKDVYELRTDRDFFFYLPDVVQKPGNGLEGWQNEFQLATEVFQRYVKARWPIHVFAIDPVAQDQNVADVSERQRELQFALALGFMSGQIGINSLTQFSRELQTQIETVTLNRTVVGFGHGADTFGWRFYPRVQALEVPGTLGTIRETIMGANRDYDLKHRRIESGQRECVAIVLMPSFVPYADFDIRTNWFKLTNPKNAALTMKDSVRLSRAVTAMRNSKAQCSECQHLYRKGEVERLFKRIDQLDRELPLQSQRALVPYENTLGGFEMFNTGVTDLTPELIGWYGAPGINRTAEYACGCYQGCNLATGGCSSSEDCTEIEARVATIERRLANVDQIPESPIPACEGPGTTLFLVGDNFSVHDTKVIAGGVCIPQTQLISRDIMRVTIPPCVNTVTLCENGSVNEYVSVYVATPYGITNHLHVPVIKPAETRTIAQSPSSANARNASTTRSAQPVVNTPSTRSQNATPVPGSAQVLTQPASGSVAADDCGCASRSVTAMAPASPTTLRAATTARAAAAASPNAQRRADSQLASLLQQGPQVPTDGLIEAVPLQIPVVQGLIESDTTMTPLLVPADALRTQIDVNVNYAEPHRMKSKLDNAPILNRVKTEIGEHWRNLRDKLPAK